MAMLSQRFSFNLAKVASGWSRKVPKKGVLSIRSIRIGKGMPHGPLENATEKSAFNPNKHTKAKKNRKLHANSYAPSFLMDDWKIPPGCAKKLQVVGQKTQECQKITKSVISGRNWGQNVDFSKSKSFSCRKLKIGRKKCKKQCKFYQNRKTN